MKNLIAFGLLVALLTGCNKAANDAKLAEDMAQPGYAETKLICTQCHKMPSPDQYRSAAWPSVVTRMEGHIRANKVIEPDQKQREAILAYLQSGRSSNQ